MARVDDFDAFYHASRAPLLHQTYALVGDADRAASAVEHAFAHAWSQWRKVRHLDDPDGWVRNEAWRVAGSQLPLRRRRGARRRFSGNPADSAHSRDLEALRDLPDGQRRAVVLHHLARLPIDRIAREIGISESSAASLLIKGEQGWADAQETTIGAALANIRADIDGVPLTRAPSLRRSGEKRHRQQTLVGVVTATGLLVGGGLLIQGGGASMQPTAAAGERADSVPAVTTPTPEAATSASPSQPETQPETQPEPFLLDQDSLLTGPEMGRLTRPQRSWTVSSTTDGTTGDPIYAPCQREPFADPDGSQSLLRRFRADDSGDTANRLAAVQVIEESRSERQAARAFETMEDWYARCGDDGVQLLGTRQVDDLGDDARAFTLRQVGRRDTFLTVGLVRTGPITTAVIASTRDSKPVPVPRVLDRAGVSVTRVCLPVSGDCSTRPQIREVPPLPAREHPGFLSAFDLPSIAHVTAPWVGTDPERSLDNPAATTCERATFGRAQRPRTRVFVLPTAGQLPRRFGVSETVGTFDGPRQARRFVDRTESSAESCSDRELSASVPNSRGLRDGLDGRVWRFEFEVNEGSSVFYRVGVVRAGRRVALISMSPSDRYDVTGRAFDALLVRAGQRLSEAR